MSLGDKLRKAAGLFLEMPPDEDGAAAAPAAPPPGDTDELDRRLAAMDASMQNSGAAATAAGVSAGGGAPPPRTIDQIVRASDGPNLDEIRLPEGTTAAALGETGTVDFAALYTAAALPSTPFTAEQTIDMIASLPESLPLEMKRQTMQVTLASIGKAIGATPESIVADTSRKLAALAAYADDFTRQSEEMVGGTEADIAFLLSQVEEKRKLILESKQSQASVQRQCASEVDRLDDVLEFFSMDVPPSRHAAPTP